MNEAYLKKLFCLDGKKAVVTGASSGIGRAISFSLANFGAEVYLLGRSLHGLEKTHSQITAAGGSAKTFVVDISNQKEVDAFFERYEKENAGQLDIFVANAGINIRSEAIDAKIEDVDALINTNYKGTLYGLIHAGNMMKEQRSGNIVVITSVNGLSPLINQAVYSSIKFALEGLTRCFAGSLAEYGVRVNSCAPGCVHSAGNEHIFSIKEFRDAKEASIPLGKIGDPEDIGDVIACMVSDAFRFMTGSTILVDGGELMRPKQKQQVSCGL